MEILSTLDDIYIAWCKMNGIKEIISADEQIYQEGMTDEQNKWLDNFVDNYSRAQQVEYFINNNIQYARIY
tara:strand:- start:224 stop:436 length:213 start_codon:yes stop_codon:yes gene_type:complete